MNTLESCLLSQYKPKIHYYTWTQRLLSILPFISYDYKVIYRLEDQCSSQMYQIEFNDGKSLDKDYCTAFKIDCAIDMDTKEPIVNDVRKTHYLDDRTGWKELAPCSPYKSDDVVTSFIYMPLKDILVQIEMDRL